MSSEITRIRWHGRGGQGAITAAKIVANAAFESGYQGIVMVPSFGTERRGAPVTTSLKISKVKINDLSPTENPDIVVVLDHLILDEVDVIEGLREGGLLVLNSPRGLADYAFKNLTLAIADVTRLSSEVGLKKGIVNSGIIGVLARAVNLVEMSVLARNIEAEFEGKKPKENARSALLAYERTVIGEK
ncbi:MAG: 2-oxoacid:acceptor oxidoreductase family protein [bacterium]|nr:2-oxoacid:acceptor oxidoreductase family protein [bacterium]